MKYSEISTKQLAQMIEHTFLKPFGLDDDIDDLCSEAKIFNFGFVAVNPAEISRCKQLLINTDIKVVGAIGFPLGQNTVRVKVYEIEDAINQGADEIDMVCNIRALQSNKWQIINHEVSALSKLCINNRVVSKIIIETCYLNNDEKKQICEIALDSGVDFIKTSTGFGPKGADVKDIGLIRSIVGNKMGIKASGGIRTLNDAIHMIHAGATRIGTSQGVQIMNDHTDVAAVRCQKG